MQVRNNVKTFKITTQAIPHLELSTGCELEGMLSPHCVKSVRKH